MSILETLREEAIDENQATIQRTYVKKLEELVEKSLADHHNYVSATQSRLVEAMELHSSPLRGNLIQQIKIVRSTFALSLSEAKSVVDKNWDDIQNSYRSLV